MRPMVRRRGQSPKPSEHPSLMSRLTAVSGIAGAVLAVPSAIIAIVQATGAEQDADNARRERIATEQIAATSQLALNEARRLSDQTARLADSGATSAAELARMSDEARRSRESLERSSRAAEQLSATTQHQVALGERALSNAARPRLVTRVGKSRTIEIGKPVKVEIPIENLNPNVPASMWISSSTRWTGLPFTLPLTNCSEKPDGKIFLIGKETSITISNLSPTTSKDIEDLQSGKRVFVVNGMICYTDGKTVYRSQFCTFVDSESSKACSTGNVADWKP